MSELERAKAIIKTMRPNSNPEFCCMLVGATIAGMRGLTMKHIRIGALFWPEKFADEPYLSMRGGWGCAGFDAREGKLFLDEASVDDDGGFNGHTWLEPEPGIVVDLMHDYEDGDRVIYGADFKTVGRYIPRPGLERAVKLFWKVHMREAVRAGKKARAA